MRVDPHASRVVVTTKPIGVLASVGHDLQIEAPIEQGSSDDGETLRATFVVARMKVVKSARHGSDKWKTPDAKDAADVESRIRDQVFAGVREVVVTGELAGATATITVRARLEQTVHASVHVERDGVVRVRGRVDLSLEALGCGQVHVPLGAMKLADAVDVTFEVELGA